MTEQEIYDELVSQGIDPNVAAQESPYLAEHYADLSPENSYQGMTDIQQVIDASLPSYMQRTLSGGDRDEGGYDTNLNDPAVTIGGYTAPARTDSNPYGLFPSAGNTEYTGPPLNGTTATGGSTWFSANSPTGAGYTFGGPPAPFGDQYTAPTRPDAIASPYTPPQFTETYNALTRPGNLSAPYAPPSWTENFVAPTMAELEADPGYQARLSAGQTTLERSAAARGSLLNGGTLQALDRYAQNYAANEYPSVFNRRLQEYQQRYGQFTDAANRDFAARGFNEGAYQADVANNLNAYNARFGAFQDSANRDLGARAMNENTYQSDVANSLNQYNTRYKQYLDAIANQRNYDTDLWNREMDLAHNALTAASLAF